MGNFPREIAGAGIKLATIPRDVNLISENPVVAVGRIASRTVGDSTVAHTMLAVPATSIPSDRAFSLAGTPHTAFCRLS